MFSSTSDTAGPESDVMRLWRAESDLAARKQAALDRASAASRAAGEQYIDGDAERVLTGARAAVAEARAEGDVLEAAIMATRRRRLTVLEAQIKREREAGHQELAQKERELKALAKKRDDLAAQICELEGAAMVPVMGDGYQRPRSGVLQSEISALQQKIMSLERATPKVRGVVEAASIEDLQARIAEQAKVTLVPCAHEVQCWAERVESSAAADVPRLAGGRLDVSPRIVTAPAGQANIGQATVSIPGGDRRIVQYRRQYALAYIDGAVDYAQSVLTLPETGQYPDHGPKSYRAASETAPR